MCSHLNAYAHKSDVLLGSPLDADGTHELEEALWVLVQMNLHCPPPGLGLPLRYDLGHSRILRFLASVVPKTTREYGRFSAQNRQ